MEAIYPSDNSVNFEFNTERYIPAYITLQVWKTFSAFAVT
jgi:hypothetical protein